MRTLLMSALLLSAGLASAQQINGYRYWFDDNVSAATTTSVAATNELVLNTALPTGNMAPGHHRVSLQVRDSNGKWSVPRTSFFVRTSGSINSYRYWLNDDLSTLVNSTVAPTSSLNLANDLAMASLTRNFNWVTLQFKEADGRYSVPHTQAFVRGTGEVNGYEYWIDDAIADRVSNSIGPSALVDLIADLPVNTTWGDHLFTIRFSSTNGTWSVPLTSEYYFFTAIEELPGISDVTVFPNPAAESIAVRMSSSAARQLQVSVLDARGALAKQFPDWSVSGTEHRSWDISELPAGSYFLQLAADGSSWNTAFVKR